MFNLHKSFNIPPAQRKYFGDRLKDHSYNMFDQANEFIDYNYNKQYPSKHDQIDTFQERLEDLTHFADNFTKIPYGMIGSCHGRMVRQNYQDIYARNPLPDKFDRAFDSYKKATEYDY